jgi:hypothetical protein
MFRPSVYGPHVHQNPHTRVATRTNALVRPQPKSDWSQHPTWTLSPVFPPKEIQIQRRVSVSETHATRAMPQVVAVLSTNHTSPRQRLYTAQSPNKSSS